MREQAVRSGTGLAWRQLMTVSLSFDHRVTDGAPAAVFLRALGEFMAQPDNFGDSNVN